MHKNLQSQSFLAPNMLIATKEKSVNVKVIML